MLAYLALATIYKLVLLSAFLFSPRSICVFTLSNLWIEWKNKHSVKQTETDK